ncbi:unnamed protein product [Cyclocybe aegerita]|uniref:F-box domain-containing protein n=1 Tax=Cyclocybe aegerita TaxID=1973307 RepID=A0A8S0XMF2_CYCAE|nr:unnamed protein product [Cyclocybe aegerita]
MLPATTDDSLLDNLPAADLLRYSRTCRDTYAAVSSYIRRTFRIECVLGRYFSPEEILHFRHLQAATGMIISGSTALQFFDRSFYPDSDLDIYVDHPKRKTIALWLAGIGYEYDPKQGLDTLDAALNHQPWWDEEKFSDSHFLEATPKGYFGAVHVFNFKKSGQKIQLITANLAPMDMILNFHSTCVMNVITHEKAYSLYPRGTFNERRTLLYLPEEPRQASAHAKYAARGWELVPTITDEEFDDPSFAFAHGNRYLGDAKCWTIPILPKLDLPESRIEAHTWALLYDTDLEPQMSFMIFRSPKLQHNYLVVDGVLRKHLRKVFRPNRRKTKEIDADAELHQIVKGYLQSQGL